MVYGIDATMPSRIRSWREHGYHVAVMTAVSWGEYGDYLDGNFDGKQHWDEAQVSSDGKQVLHGSNPKIPYIAPSASYGRFLIQAWVDNAQVSRRAVCYAPLLRPPAHDDYCSGMWLPLELHSGANLRDSRR